MKNMWLLVSVVLAGVALWFWRKFTPRAAMAGAPTAAPLARPLGAPTGTLAETPRLAPEEPLITALRKEIAAGTSGLEQGFQSEEAFMDYLGNRGLMRAPSGEVVSIALYKATAATSPTGVPDRYMRTLCSGEKLLPTGEVKMPSGEIKPMTESLYWAFGTGDPYVKQLEAQLGHKLYS